MSAPLLFTRVFVRDIDKMPLLVSLPWLAPSSLCCHWARLHPYILPPEVRPCCNISLPIAASIDTSKRAIPLGPLPDTGIIPGHGRLVHRLDFHRGPARASSIGSLRRGIATAGTYHPEPHGQLCSCPLARDVVLLAGVSIFNCREHLRVQDPTAHQYRRW